ncbi:MAG TPA: hypothetical protein DC031_00050 [Sulfitobacter sp.]|uniref:LuxR C-terminal-related transcriptional regulator n=1 Tax=Sulfitobacter dubius TaxID=218673 RepID=UPI000C5C3DED|nr:hypothetical protein [Sulfitobacter sp.]HBB81680.1 hypothetical protein [Sulfitobacter sp.]
MTSLSAKQRDCLAYSADGLRTAEVTYKLGISEATIELRVRNARTRFDAKIRHQTVAIALGQDRSNEQVDIYY